MKNNSKHKLNKLPSYLFYGVLVPALFLYAFVVLSSYTKLHQFQFCFNDCSPNNPKQSLSYAPSRISIQLANDVTHLGKNELFLTKSENAVLSVEKITTNGQTNYQLKNISQNTTVLVDDRSLPELPILGNKDDVLIIEDNIITFYPQESNTQGNDLKIVVTNKKINKKATYELIQGKVNFFSSESAVKGQANLKGKPSCYESSGLFSPLKNPLNKFKSKVSNDFSGRRSISFGGMMICENRIPVLGVEPNLFLLNYDKQKGYYIRPKNENMQALHNNIVRYGENRTLLREKPFVLEADKTYRIKMGYSKFESMRLEGDKLVFIPNKDASLKKIMENQASPNPELISLEVNSLIDYGLKGILGLFFIFAVIFGYSYYLNNKQQDIDKNKQQYIDKKTLSILVCLLFSPIAFIYFVSNVFSFSDYAWMTFGLMLMVGLLTYQISFISFAQNKTNTRHIIAIFSYSVMLLLVINIDYGVALNIAEESTKYFNDFKKQVMLINLFLYIWLSLLLILSSNFTNKKLTKLINKNDSTNKSQEGSAPNKSKVVRFIVVGLSVIFLSIFAYYYYTTEEMFDKRILMVVGFLSSIFLAYVLAKMLEIVRVWCSKNNSEVQQGQVHSLRIISFVLVALIFVQLFFGSETGLGGYFQPNEVMKFFLCSLMSWMLISAKSSELEMVILSVFVAVMLFILSTLNDYSYGFFLLFLFVAFCLSKLHRRFFWFVNYKETFKDFSVQQAFPKRNSQRVILAIVAICSMAFIWVSWGKPFIVVGILSPLLFFMTVYGYLMYRDKHENDQNKSRSYKQNNVILRYGFVVSFFVYFTIGLYSCLLLIFHTLPKISFLNKGNTAERLQVWQSLLSHEQTGHQLLKAYKLYFDEHAVQNFIKVPEVDDDFAYTGWLYGDTFAHSGFLWVAIFLYVFSLLWLIKEIGVMPHFKSIVAKQKQHKAHQKNWSEIIEVAQRYEHHKFSASAFVVCALSVFMVHVILSTSTNLNYLPVVGQPFPYLGRQGSHLIFFELLVVLTVVYFLIRHLHDTNKTDLVPVTIYPVNNKQGTMFAFSPPNHNGQGVDWSFNLGVTRNQFKTDSMKFWSHQSIEAYVNTQQDSRNGYVLGERGVLPYPSAVIELRLPKIGIEVKEVKENEGLWGLNSVRQKLAEHGVGIAVTVKQEEGKEVVTVNIIYDQKEYRLFQVEAQMNQNNQPAQPVNLNNFDRLKQDMQEWQQLRVNKRQLDLGGNFMPFVELPAPKKALNFDASLNDLANWYIAILGQNHDEFVLYMGQNEQRRQVVAELLCKYAVKNGGAWQLGSLNIQQAEQEQQAQYGVPITCLSINFSVIEE